MGRIKRFPSRHHLHRCQAPGLTWIISAAAQHVCVGTTGVMSNIQSLGIMILAFFQSQISNLKSRCYLDICHIQVEAPLSRTGDRCRLCAICSSSNLEAAAGGGGGGGKCGDEDGIWRGYAELPPVSGMSGLSLPQPGLLGHSSTNYATKTQPNIYLQSNTRDFHLLYLFKSDLWSLFIILQPSIYLQLYRSVQEHLFVFCPPSPAPWPPLRVMRSIKSRPSFTSDTSKF